MKTTELRIGNYLIADIGNVKVESVLGSTYRLYCHSIDEDYLADYKISDLKPIPLTEDILLKCGFVKQDNELIMKVNTYGCLVYWHKEMFLMMGQFADCTDTIDCKYLHTLQNIYFALCGEELNINL